MNDLVEIIKLTKELTQIMGREYNWPSYLLLTWGNGLQVFIDLFKEEDMGSIIGRMDLNGEVRFFTS